MREFGEGAWAASIGGGTHASYTQIGMGNVWEELPPRILHKALGMKPIGDRIPTLCPQMKARGICRVPNCAFRHEVFRTGRTTPAGGLAREHCKDVRCRFAAVLGTCPQGSSCAYCHDAKVCNDQRLQKTCPPGPIPGSGQGPDMVSEAPSSASTSAASTRTPSQRSASRPGTANLTMPAVDSGRRDAGKGYAGYAGDLDITTKPGGLAEAIAAAAAVGAARPGSALSRLSAGSRGSRGSRGKPGVAGGAGDGSSRGNSARTTRSASSTPSGRRRAIPVLTYVGPAGTEHQVAFGTGGVPPLALRATGLLFKSRC